jgi:hypothetical protein
MRAMWPANLVHHSIILITFGKGYKLLSLSLCSLPHSSLLLSQSKYSRRHVVLKQPRPMKSTSFYYVTLCGLVEVYERFGGTNCLHLQSRRVNPALNKEAACATFLFACWAYSSNLKMEVIRS